MSRRISASLPRFPGLLKSAGNLSTLNVSNGFRASSTVILFTMAVLNLSTSSSNDSLKAIRIHPNHFFSDNIHQNGHDHFLHKIQTRPRFKITHFFFFVFNQNDPKSVHSDLYTHVFAFLLPVSPCWSPPRTLLHFHFRFCLIWTPEVTSQKFLIDSLSSRHLGYAN